MPCLMAKMTPLAWTSSILTVFIVFIQLSQEECVEPSIDLLIVADYGTNSLDKFYDRQRKLIDTIRYVEYESNGRDIKYGAIAFHESSTILVSLASSPLSKQRNETMKRIVNLRPKLTENGSSPARAFDLASDQYIYGGRVKATKILVLSHNGNSTDWVAGTLEARKRLLDQGVFVFVVSSADADTNVLIGYASRRSRIYTYDVDRMTFFRSIHMATNRCGKEWGLDKISAVTTHFGLSTSNTHSLLHLGEWRKICKPGKLDLMIAIDTSGSIFNSFLRDKELAANLMISLNSTIDKGLKIGIITFAESPQLLLPLSSVRTIDNVLHALENIKFTGGDTYISRAIDYALEEFDKKRRSDASQLLLLITDGYGQEFWHVVQSTRRKIISSEVHVFATSASEDYNKMELELYAGDSWKIFVGDNYKRFSLALAPLLLECFKPGNIDLNLQSEFLDSSYRLLHEGGLNGSSAGLEKLVPLPSLLEDGKSDAIYENYGNPHIKTYVTHIAFVIDRSITLNSEFGKQIRFAIHAANKLASRKVRTEFRFIMIAIGEDSRAEFTFTLQTPAVEIIKRLKAIEHATGDAPAANAISHASQYKEFDPQSQHLIVALVTDEKNSTSWLRISKTISELDWYNVCTVNASCVCIHLYALIFRSDQRPAELQSYANGKWKVYTAEGSNQLIDDMREAMIKCEEQPENIGKTNYRFENMPQSNESLDIVIVLDRSKSMLDDFETGKQLIRHLIMSIPEEDYDQKIRVSLITFNDSATVENDLNETISRDQLLEKLDLVQNIGGETSAASGMAMAVDQIKSAHRDGTRLIVILLSDGGSKDAWTTVRFVANQLRATGADIYAATVSERYFENELNEYTGDSERVALNLRNKTDRFIRLLRSVVFIPYLDAVETDNDLLPIGMQLLEPTVMPSFAYDMDDELNEVVLDPNCTVDLIFVVDTSQSVESIFNRQLEFPFQLIGHIAPSAFESQLRVAVISFNIESTIEFRFDDFKKSEEIMNALSQLQHDGGGTSLVTAMCAAIDMMQSAGRTAAKKFIVLISDGNSQDPWESVSETASRLCSLDITVFAVAASSDYFFKELEMYAKNGRFVYVDKRRNHFVSEAVKLISECGSSLIPSETTISPVWNSTHTLFRLSNSDPDHETSNKETIIEKWKELSIPCEDDLVDIAVVLDTSASIYDVFETQKNFASDLIRILPAHNFEKRFNVALIKFASDAELKFGFGQVNDQNDILHEIESTVTVGGATSIAAGMQELLKEIESKHRPGSRLIVVLISDGNSQDPWLTVQSTAKQLHKTQAKIYAVTLSPFFYFDELKEYTGCNERIYIDDRISQYLKEVANETASCHTKTGTRQLDTQEPDKNLWIEDKLVPSMNAKYLEYRQNLQSKRFQDLKAEQNGRPKWKRSEVVRGVKPIEETYATVPGNYDQCNYSKMDLEIIMDASTSRHGVFEQQRELALSLIERLPVDANKTHVAIGINSFTNVPTLRQTLGLGRDKQMVRHAIESIQYKGGSTLTSKAVQLSVQDLQRGRRPDAIQVVVLMNDGLSQDLWDMVLMASDKLRATGAERFGVALGEDIDLRELKLYIGDDDRIYRDGSTEKFLSDIVNLLGYGKDCEKPLTAVKRPIISLTSQCRKEPLDIVILFDNADETNDLSDPAIISNRYLLLDILGSLLTDDNDHDFIKFAVIQFAGEPNVILSLKQSANKTTVFNTVEKINAVRAKASYAKAVTNALHELEIFGHRNAKKVLLIVGDGRSEDTESDIETAIYSLRNVKAGKLTSYAIDSRKSVETASLKRYTNSTDRIYNYDRNADFAKVIFEDVKSVKESNCAQNLSSVNNRDNTNRISGSKSISHNFKSKLKDIIETNENSIIDKTKIVEVKQPLNSTTTPSKPHRLVATTSTYSNPPESSTSVFTKFPTSTATITKKPRLYTRTTNINFRTGTVKTVRAIVSTSKPRTKKIVENTLTIPGCKIDLLIMIDASGSVEDTFIREKQLASGIIERLNIGEHGSRVAIIKFASEDKVQTIWSFTESQNQTQLKSVLNSLGFSSGTTAIHMALQQAIHEYTQTSKRTEKSTPVCVLFTDGFGQRDTTDVAKRLRKIVPDIFAIAINHQYPISHTGLETITGSKERVFTDANINVFYKMFEKLTKRC